MVITRPTHTAPDTDVSEGLFKEARRRRRRRRAMFAAVALIAICIIASYFGALSGAGGRQPPHSSSGSSSSSSRLPRGTRSSTPSHASGRTNPTFGNLETSVSPTGPISFASSTVGWLAEPVEPLSGQEVSVAGVEPGQETGKWKVLATHDAGKEWVSTLEVSPYVWGLYSVGTQHVWVMASNALYSSSDGGLVWSRIGEPRGSALVRASFANATDGYGLTVDGDLATTVNGGRTWVDRGHSWIPDRRANYIHGATNLCSSGPALLMGDSSGDIFRSTDPLNPKSWTEVLSFDVPAGFAPLSILDCSNDGVTWETTYTEVQGPQGGTLLQWTGTSSDSGLSWKSAGGIEVGGGGFHYPSVSTTRWGNAFSDGMVPSSEAPRPMDERISYATGSPISLLQSTDGVSFTVDNVNGLLDTDSLRSGGLPSSVSIFGVSFDSPTDGWLDAGDQKGTSSAHESESNIVFHTTDGGSNWRAVYASSSSE